MITSLLALGAYESPELLERSEEEGWRFVADADDDAYLDAENISLFGFATSDTRYWLGEWGGEVVVATLSPSVVRVKAADVSTALGLLFSDAVSELELTYLSRSTGAALFSLSARFPTGSGESHEHPWVDTNAIPDGPYFVFDDESGSDGVLVIEAPDAASVYDVAGDALAEAASRDDT